MTRKQIEDLLLNLPLKEVIREIKKSCWCEVTVQNNLLIVADYDMQCLDTFRLDEDIANEAMSELEMLSSVKDPESAHWTADGVLCRVLESLGYEKVVEAYKKVPKWYC